MNRATAGFDRVATAVVGVALVGVGVGAIAWQRGMLPEDRAVVDAGALVSAESASWWPWALGAAAVVLVLLGLRWLIAHRPYRRVHAVSLDGAELAGDTPGTLTTDLGAAAKCAADGLAGRPGVESATGRAVSDRGERVVEISAVLDAEAARTGIDDAAAATERDLAAALDGAAVKTRILLQVGRTRRSAV